MIRDSARSTCGCTGLSDPRLKRSPKLRGIYGNWPKVATPNISKTHVSQNLGGFPNWGYPQSWMVYFMENRKQKWMMTGGYPSIPMVIFHYKPTVRMGFSTINHPFWGTPISGNPQSDAEFDLELDRLNLLKAPLLGAEVWPWVSGDRHHERPTSGTSGALQDERLGCNSDEGL